MCAYLPVLGCLLKCSGELVFFDLVVMIHELTHEFQYGGSADASYQWIYTPTKTGVPIVQLLELVRMPCQILQARLVNVCSFLSINCAYNILFKPIKIK